MTELFGNNEQLKPCPFCGSTNIKHYDTDYESGITHFTLCCENCGGLVDSSDYKNRKDAVKAWNTRLIEDVLKTKIKELEEKENGYREFVVKHTGQPGLEFFIVRYGELQAKLDAMLPIVEELLWQKNYYHDCELAGRLLQLLLDYEKASNNG